MDFKLPERTQYLVISGSHAYGTNTPTSDYDVRGWLIPPEPYFHSFNKRFEQSDQSFEFMDYPFRVELEKYINTKGYRNPPEDEIIDHCIYDIRKFFALAADCNPNVIELLYVDQDDILMCSHLGKHVRDKRDLFMSAKAKHTFTGYAVSQLKRINTHRRWLLNPPTSKPKRSDFGLPETGIITAEQRGAAEALVNAQIREWLGQDSDLGQTELSIFHEKLTDFISRILSSKELILELKDEKELIRTARLAAMEKIGMAKNYIAILQTEKEYRDQLQEWTQYEEWKKNRNPARVELEAKYGYDTKHGMQLVRLLIAGKEILTRGTFTVKSAETDMLLKVKRGEWSYDEIIKYLKSIDKELQDIYDNKKYVVPHRPDMVGLNEVCEEMVRVQLQHDRGLLPTSHVCRDGVINERYCSLLCSMCHPSLVPIDISPNMGKSVIVGTADLAKKVCEVVRNKK